MLRLSVCVIVVALSLSVHSQAAKPVNVLVWDEQQPVTPKIYANFPGNYIADQLRRNDRLSVTSANINQPQQGLSSEALRAADVLVYWGHVRHRDISAEKSQEIVDLIKQGKLAMLTLHSAHWSVPFMVAMQEKAAQDALQRLPKRLRDSAIVRFEGKIDWEIPAEFDRNYIDARYQVRDNGNIEVVVERPACVFPRCCTPKQPSQMRIIHTDHPIAAGLPKTFTIPATEMYDEPYHIPEPDELILDEMWAGGEYFRSGALWNIGRGRVFYFRPGDQQYPVYKEKLVLKIIENACLWLGENKDVGAGS